MSLITPYVYIIAYPKRGKSQSKWGDKELVLVFVNNTNVFLKKYLVVKVLMSLCINCWMQILGQNLSTIKLFDTLGPSSP